MYNLDHMTVNEITRVPNKEFYQRRDKVKKVLEEQKVEGMVFFSASSIFYLTGSALLQTERPVIYVYRNDGESALLVPTLEYEHTQLYTDNCKVYCYPEYPGERHPMHYLVDLLKEFKLDNKPLAADGNGAPAHWGYKGPKLTDLCPDLQLTLLPELINDLRIIKSDYEVSLLRESARWGHYTHILLQEYIRPGLSEIEVCMRTQADAAAVMLKALGPNYELSGNDGIGLYADIRGQVGPHSYYPHAANINAIFKKGDSLVTGAGTWIFGYLTELERTLFVGEPSKEQEKYYKLAVEAQKAAYSMIKPGNRCCDVDRELMRFFKENDIMDCWRHHTGHSLGSVMHQRPFFDIGDETVLEPNMVLSVEPGIYVKGLGGFRCSDTVLITETGFEQLTHYTKDIDKLICSDH